MSLSLLAMHANRWHPSHLFSLYLAPARRPQLHRDCRRGCLFATEVATAAADANEGDNPNAVMPSASADAAPGRRWRDGRRAGVEAGEITAGGRGCRGILPASTAAAGALGAGRTRPCYFVVSTS